MNQGNSTIREELRKFREIKRNHGLLEVSLNRTFENSKDMIRFAQNNEDNNQQKCNQKKKSHIFIANHLDYTSNADNNLFSNPILNGILSPSTAQRLELVKQMEAFEENNMKEKMKSDQQDMLFTDEDKENVNTINNQIIHHHYKTAVQSKPMKNTFEPKKSNNRYISQDRLSLSRNTLFATDKSFDLIDYKQTSNNRILEKEKNQQTATFKNQFTLECGGTSDREGVGFESIDGNFLTPSVSSTIDLNKKTRLSRSKDNCILDHDIISFYQNIKVHKEKQMKSFKKSDGKSPNQEKQQNMNKPPKRTNNMVIKTDLLNDSLLNKSYNRVSNSNVITQSISLLKSDQQNSTVILSTSPYNPRESRTEKTFTRSLTPVNQCSLNPINQSLSGSSQNTIEIRKLNLYEEDDLRQQIDILLKEKEQDRLLIASLKQDHKYLQNIAQNSQQAHQQEIQNHKMQIDMLQEKIAKQDQHINHLNSLNYLNHQQVDKEELQYLKNESMQLREAKAQTENAQQHLQHCLNEKIQENIQFAEQVIFLRTELDKYMHQINRDKKKNNNNNNQILDQSINYSTNNIQQEQEQQEQQGSRCHESIYRQPAKGQNLNITYEDDSNNLNNSKMLADVSTYSQSDVSTRPKRSYSQGFQDGELNTINLSQYNANSSHFQKSDYQLSETFKKIPLSSKCSQQKNSQRSLVEQTRRIHEQNYSGNQLNCSATLSQTINCNSTQRYCKKSQQYMYLQGGDYQHLLLPLPQKTNPFPELLTHQNN